MSSSFHLNQIKEFEQDVEAIHEIDTSSCHEPPFERFSMMILYFRRNCLVINITTLKHVDHNVEDVYVDNEPMFLEELFKDECDHSFEKTCVEELKSRVLFGK